MAVKEYGQHGLIGELIYLLISVVSSILFLIIFSNCRESSFVMKAFAYIGRMTITLLCTQMIIIKMSNKVMFSVIENTMLVGWISVIITLLRGWLMSSGMKKIKNKALKWVRYL